jgi:hypothetical protein
MISVCRHDIIMIDYDSEVIKTYTSGARVAAASNAPPPVPNALVVSLLPATEPNVMADVPNPNVAPLDVPNENDGLEPNEPNVGAIHSIKPTIR